MQLLNKRYVAYGQCEMEDIRASMPDCSDGICRVSGRRLSIQVDDIVRKIIMNRLQTMQLSTCQLKEELIYG